MATIADELNAISVEHGYTGAAPKTIAGAIDALADTLAGTNVEERRTIAGAVKALAPYIGAGGGSGFEPKGMNEISILSGIVGTAPAVFDAGTNEPSTDGPIIMFNDANVCKASASSISICGGLNVLATMSLASGVDADSVCVFQMVGGSYVEVPSTKKVITSPSGDRMLFIAFKTLEKGAVLSIGMPSFG